MKIVFWGTSEFAVPSLLALDAEGYDVVGVVTRPDRPAGRGRRLAASPVKAAASEQGLNVLTPDRPKGEEFLAELRALEADLAVVVAYGHILRTEVLDAVPMGFLNVHASLLPELRGAAPVNWAILRGHERTGVTIMRVVEALDAGPILLQVAEPVLPDETASELSTRLSEIGAEALVETLALLAAGAVEEVEQDHSRATFAPKIDREAARIDWTRSAREVAWHIRGMDAVPGAWSEVGEVPVKLFRPRVLTSEEVPAPAGGVAGNGHPAASDVPSPGTVVAFDPERGLAVAAGDGHVLVREVQPPGKRRMSAADWVHGRGIAPGQRFR